MPSSSRRVRPLQREVLFPIPKKKAYALKRVAPRKTLFAPSAEKMRSGFLFIRRMKMNKSLFIMPGVRWRLTEDLDKRKM